MTTVIDMPARRVPRDTFPIRLAIVRAEMGWNYDQAERATGINSETWRLWEKGKRRCTDIETASRQVSHATGFSFEWLMIGGALDSNGPSEPNGESRPNNPCYSRRTVILGPWDSTIAHISAA